MFAKSFRIGLIALVLLAVAFLMSPAPRARAIDAMFTVNQTGDQSDADTGDGKCDVDLVTSGDQCTLRAAIQQANAGAEISAIVFNLASPATITPSAELPEITAPVIMDALYRSGSSGAPVVLLDGSSAGAADGLRITGGGSTVRGLIINGFSGDGIELSGGKGVNVILSNFIGTNRNGSSAVGNGVGIRIANSGNNEIGSDNLNQRNVISGNVGHGIYVTGASGGTQIFGNVIGMTQNGSNPLPNGGDGVFLTTTTNILVGGAGEGERNYISGNTGSGVVFSADADGNFVYGNFIGLDADEGDGGNGGYGVYISGGEDNQIGGAEAGKGNLIGYNGADGVAVENPYGRNAILRNGIDLNGGLGIDLGNDGVTANDSKDPDAGANGLQNFPVLTKTAFGGVLFIEGSLNSLPNTQFLIEFFVAPDCDVSTYGEGRVFIIATTVTTKSDGTINFSGTADASVKVGDDFITATATRINSGNRIETSEFSKCSIVTQSSVTVTKTPTPTKTSSGGGGGGGTYKSPTPSRTPTGGGPTATSTFNLLTPSPTNTLEFFIFTDTPTPTRSDTPTPTLSLVTSPTETSTASLFLPAADRTSTAIAEAGGGILQNFNFGLLLIFIIPAVLLLVAAVVVELIRWLNARRVS